MATVRKILLQDDKTSTRLKFVEDKVIPLCTPDKVFVNPSWPLPETGEVKPIDGVEYDEEEIIEILDQAGTDLEALASAEDRLDRDAKLAIDLHEHLKDLPRKVLFDNAFWMYLFWKSPIYNIHRYDVWDEDSEKINGTRLVGNWRRASVACAYMTYYLAAEVGITEDQYKETGSRLRMWITDQLPLIPNHLRKVFIGHVIDDTNADTNDATWEKLFQNLGSINVDDLTEAQIQNIFSGFSTPVPAPEE